MENHTTGIKNWLIVLGLALTTTLSFAQMEGHEDHGGRMHGEDWPEGLEQISISGTVSIDLSFGQAHYYIDTNSDAEFDYQLGFGPWWYIPESGAVRPTQDENVDILGGLIADAVPPMVVVFELNGLVWRDSTGNPPWSGGWAHQGAMDSTYIFCPSDSLSNMGIPPQSMLGMGYPDSIYCQFEELEPDSMPGMHDSSHFAGFQCAFLSPDGNHMGGGMGHDESMGFSMNLELQFHYDQELLEMMGLDEESITIYSTDDTGVWDAVTAFTLNLDENTVVVSSSAIASYYVLQAQAATATDQKESLGIPADFAVKAVFPNPFNPTTTINFHLPRAGFVNLRIFDVKGSLVSEQNFGSMNSGDHNVTWSPGSGSSSDIPGGVYLVQLVADGNSVVRKITYLK